MNILIIINDPPYGSEKAYNALRMALSLLKENPENLELRIFLMADAVTCALPNQSTPQGYYNIERMLKGVMVKGGIVKACGSCAEARGIANLPLIEGIEISTMSQLCDWTVTSERVVSF